MNFKYWIRQFSAGTISGLSLSVYSISCGALLASLQLPNALGMAIGAMLVTGIVGSCYGLISKDKTLVCGPDANSVSVMTGFMVVFLSLLQSVELKEEIIPILMVLSALIAAIILLLSSYFKLYQLIRFVPFSVIAGFLASSGFLMIKGATEIISINFLSIEGFQEIIAHPLQPQLLVGLLIAGSLIYFSKLFSPGVVIPTILIIFCILINLIIRNGLCIQNMCAVEQWFFSSTGYISWIPSWNISWTTLKIDEVFNIIPYIFFVVLVAILTILFTLTSLEMNNTQEFDLSLELRSHSFLSIISGFFGGLIPVLAIARITINKTMGGGVPAGIISGGFAIATMAGGEVILSYIPKVCLGGLLMFLGINLLKGWTINQRSKVDRIEIVQVVLIVTIVSRYGFFYGVIAGIIMACIFFVINYSKISVTYLQEDLTALQSSVVRPDHEQRILEEFGHRVRIFRLGGYLFFGSIYELDKKISQLDIKQYDCIIFDFNKVSGIDSSASQVFQRILNRYSQYETQWFFSYTTLSHKKLLAAQKNQKFNGQVLLFKSFDTSLEAAEDLILEKHQANLLNQTCFPFLSTPLEIEQFKDYCELKNIPQNALLVQNGDYSNEIFFLKSGEFEVIKLINHQEIRLAKLKSGAMVGELAFYNQGIRSASIRAHCFSEVFMLTEGSLKKMRENDPHLANQLDFYVIRKISQSLTKTNKLIDSII